MTPQNPPDFVIEFPGELTDSQIEGFRQMWISRGPADPVVLMGGARLRYIGGQPQMLTETITTTREWDDLFLGFVIGLAVAVAMFAALILAAVVLP